MTYPNFKKGDTTLLKAKTKVDEIEHLIFKTENHGDENLSKSLKIDKNFYNKKNFDVIEKKFYNDSIRLGCCQRLNSWLHYLVNVKLFNWSWNKFRCPITEYTSFLASFATLILNE